MKVKVKRQFKDLQEGAMRYPGEMFEATRKRAEQLHQLGLVNKIQEKIEAASLPKKYMEVGDAEERPVQDTTVEEDQKTYPD